jgi:excinuclease UvrABC ATPase subunit
MGPEGGNKGGEVIFEGTPAQLVEAEHSLTGVYMRGDGVVPSESDARIAQP